MVHQHALWLKTQGQEGKRFNMKGRNLSDFDLSGADLRGAKLQNAKLFETNLAGTLRNLRP